jgi:hypothetical protein
MASIILDYSMNIHIQIIRPNPPPKPPPNPPPRPPLNGLFGNPVGLLLKGVLFNGTPN